MSPTHGMNDFRAVTVRDTAFAQEGQRLPGSLQTGYQLKWTKCLQTVYNCRHFRLPTSRALRRAQRAPETCLRLVSSSTWTAQAVVGGPGHPPAAKVSCRHVKKGAVARKGSQILLQKWLLGTSSARGARCSRALPTLPAMPSLAPPRPARSRCCCPCSLLTHDRPTCLVRRR